MAKLTFSWGLNLSTRHFVKINKTMLKISYLQFQMKRIKSVFSKNPLRFFFSWLFLSFLDCHCIGFKAGLAQIRMVQKCHVIYHKNSSFSVSFLSKIIPMSNLNSTDQVPASKWLSFFYELLRLNSNDSIQIRDPLLIFVHVVNLIC